MAMSAPIERSRRSERRVATYSRHEGHSFLPVRRLCSMHALQKRCKHSVATGSRRMPRQMRQRSSALSAAIETETLPSSCGCEARLRIGAIGVTQS